MFLHFYLNVIFTVLFIVVIIYNILSSLNFIVQPFGHVGYCAW